MVKGVVEFIEAVQVKCGEVAWEMIERTVEGIT